MLPALNYSFEEIKCFTPNWINVVSSSSSSFYQHLISEELLVVYYYYSGTLQKSSNHWNHNQLTIKVLIKEM